MNLSMTALLLVVLSSVAQAEPVSFMTDLRSEKVDGIIKVVIEPAGNGTLQVTLNPNHCHEGFCTYMALISSTVEPKILQDKRSTGGPLLLQLTPDVQLEEILTHGPNQSASITAIVTDENGQATRLAMTAEVFLTVN